MKGDRGKIKTVLWAVLLIYIGWLLYFTIFAERLGRVPQDPGADVRYNLLPFTEIWRYIRYRDILGPKAVILNLAGNVIVFVPVGILLPLCMKRCERPVGAIVIGLLITFLIECTQIILRVGSFDVDDILLNTLGVVIGYILYLGLRKRINKKTPVEIRRIE